MDPKDYQPSDLLKKVWSVEVDLLQKFIDVCNRHNLTYFAIGGTLLGAARHNGFIPWDDDVDIAMPRMDYIRLQQLAQSEFKFPYFFQTPVTERNARFFRPHAQLRNSMTTGYIAADANKRINKGIFIDIFPLDELPDDEKLCSQFKFDIQRRANVMRRYCSFHDVSLSKRIRLRYLIPEVVFKIYSYHKYYERFEKLLGMYSGKGGDFVGLISFMWDDRFIWPIEWFDDKVYLDFEGLKICAPRLYQNVLAKTYGDWRKFPANVDVGKGSLHGTVFFDPDVSYLNYDNGGES